MEDWKTEMFSKYSIPNWERQISSYHFVDRPIYTQVDIKEKSRKKKQLLKQNI